MVGLAIVVFWIAVAASADLMLALGLIYDPLVSLETLVAPGGFSRLDGATALGAGTVADVCALVTAGEHAGLHQCPRHWLGTDFLGRDVLSRVVFGSRTVLTYAPLATLCAYAVGVPMGLIAGYRGGGFAEAL